MVRDQPGTPSGRDVRWEEHLVTDDSRVIVYSDISLECVDELSARRKIA